MGKITTFIDKNKKYSTDIVRIAVSIVLLWFGIDEIVNPENWFGYFPHSLINFLPFGLNTFFILNGFFEIVVGILLLIGLYTRIVAFVVSLHLLSITIALGYNDVAVRDFGLALATLSLVFSGAGEFSLDSKFRKRFSEDKEIKHGKGKT